MRFNDARTWGVEIEFKGNKNLVIANMQTRGLQISDAGYSHETMQSWKMVSDSSAQWELVSPPLAGTEGFRQLKLACEALNATDAKVDTSCGLHVHHIARDLPEIAIRRFIKLYCRYEGVIDTLVAPSRRNNENQYSHSLRLRLRNDDDYHNLDRATNLYNFNGTRYMKVNLESMERHGTVEVRHHQGSTDYAKIKAWIVFTQALLNHAIDARVSNNAKSTWESLKIIIGAVGVRFQDETSREAIEYLNTRNRAFCSAAGITSRTVIEAMCAPMNPIPAISRRAARREARVETTMTDEELDNAIAEDRAAIGSAQVDEAHAVLEVDTENCVCASCGYIPFACNCGNGRYNDFFGYEVPRRFVPVVNMQAAAAQYEILVNEMLPWQGSCACEACRSQRREALNAVRSANPS